MTPFETILYFGICVAASGVLIYFVCHALMEE